MWRCAILLSGSGAEMDYIDEFLQCRIYSHQNSNPEQNADSDSRAIQYAHSYSYSHPSDSYAAANLHTISDLHAVSYKSSLHHRYPTSYFYTQANSNDVYSPFHLYAKTNQLAYTDKNMDTCRRLRQELCDRC